METKPSTFRSFISLVVFSSIFLCVGLVIFLGSVDVIHIPDENINAPRWVIASAGATFFLGGAMMLVNGLKIILGGDHWILSGLTNTLAMVMMLSLAIPFHWVAFGSGEREFSGSVGVGPVTFVDRGGEVGGRIAFGLFAVLLDISIIAVFTHMITGTQSEP